MDWKSIARRKYLELVGDAAAATAVYRSMVDKQTNLKIARDSQADWLAKAEAGIMEFRSDGESHAYQQRLAKTRREISNLDDALADVNHRVDKAVQASQLPIRLANEAKALLRKLNVISPAEFAS